MGYFLFRPVGAPGCVIELHSVKSAAFSDMHWHEELAACWLPPGGGRAASCLGTSTGIHTGLYSPVSHSISHHLVLSSPAMCCVTAASLNTD